MTIKQGAVTETLTDFPLLVVFPPVSPYPMVEYKDKTNIAFIDTKGNILPHEFEGPPLLDGDSMEVMDCDTRPRNIWVKTNIDADADTCIFMYYDNGGGQMIDMEKLVWSNPFTNVWHVNSSIDAWENSVMGAAAEPCRTGDNDRQQECEENIELTPPYPTPCLNGTACRNIPNTQPVGFIGEDLLSTSKDHTLSFWWAPWDPNNYTNKVILGAFTAEDPVCKMTMDPSPPCKLVTPLKRGNFIFATNAENQAYLQILKTDEDSDQHPLISSITPNQWYNIVITTDDAHMNVYVDGKKRTALPVPRSNPEPINVVCLGGNWWDTKELPGLEEQPSSFVDEIQISDTIRSSAWIDASYRNRTCPNSDAPPDTCPSQEAFIDFSQPETQ